MIWTAHVLSHIGEHVEGLLYNLINSTRSYSIKQKDISKTLELKFHLVCFLSVDKRQRSDTLDDAGSVK